MQRRIEGILARRARDRHFTDLILQKEDEFGVGTVIRPRQPLAAVPNRSQKRKFTIRFTIVRGAIFREKLKEAGPMA
jgi:hypothetical protein